jgi:hypothetical protein
VYCCHSGDNETVRQPKITRAAATAIAKAECEARRWPWIEPVAVEVSCTFPPDDCGWRHWFVRTNANVQRPDPNIAFAVSFDGLHVRAHWSGRTEPPE